MTKSKIILDTDPGGDDALAFLWLQSLVKQGYADLVAVTAADGNVSAKQTFVSVHQLLQLGRLTGVEVGRGIIAPSHDIEDAAHIHGQDGMGNLTLTLPQVSVNFAEGRGSDEVLIEKLTTFPGEITIIAIGPLRNLAAAELKSPGVLKLAKEIVIMGGAVESYGNVTPMAEFNIAFDPEAAEIVFASSQNIVVLPLDLTRHLLFTPELAREVHNRQVENPISRFILSLCQFMTQTAMAHRETQGKQGFLVHDAATLAYLFYPETLLFRRAQVDIETQGKWTRGKMLIDSRHTAKSTANAWIAVQGNYLEILSILVEDLKRFLQV